MIVRAEHGLVGCLERQPVLVAGCRTTWGPLPTRSKSGEWTTSHAATAVEMRVEGPAWT